MLDLLIRGASVYDGSGGSPRTVDVSVHDGKILSLENTKEKAKLLNNILSESIFYE